METTRNHLFSDASTIYGTGACQRTVFYIIIEHKRKNPDVQRRLNEVDLRLQLTEIIPFVGLKNNPVASGVLVLKSGLVHKTKNRLEFSRTLSRSSFHMCEFMVATPLDQMYHRDTKMITHPSTTCLGSPDIYVPRYRKE